MSDDRFMQLALVQAREAQARGDRPVGCVIVHGERIVSRGANRVRTGKCELEHAEIIAIREGSEYLDRHARDCVLYTTLEPCLMCLGAIAAAKVGTVVYGQADPARGGSIAYEQIPFVWKNIQTYRGGVLVDECTELRSPFQMTEK